MPADIVLTTLNAKYAHAAFGLRYLLANLGPLRERARILEFDVSTRPTDALEVVLAQNPRIVGVGVYIWNAEQSARLVADLKRVRPDVLVVLGGPEVSHETDQQEIVRHADYVVTGEADLTFAELCRGLLLENRRPLMKVIPSAPPVLDRLVLPYDLYDEQDVAHRVVYVEASRGCPFKCEFCLSSLDVPVRNAPPEEFLAHMGRLLDRGVRRFKFVDRTFNLNLNISRGILEFFLDRMEQARTRDGAAGLPGVSGLTGLFLHFEMIPDRLPEALREPIKRFPPGALQFEVGVQTFNDDVSKRISRRQDNAKLAENLRFLREQTGVHVHADLIVGLPGEDVDSFAAGFDRLVALGPQEIQVGMLKRLRGTPIVRHDAEWGMVYSPHAPYEVLQTKSVDFATMQRLRRFSRYWDLIANSGNFVRTAPLVWAGGASPFRSFLNLSDWIFARAGRNHAIALQTLAEILFQYLTTAGGQDTRIVARALWDDYRQGGRRDGPEFLREFVDEDARQQARRTLPAETLAPPRQSRHLRAPSGHRR